MIKVTEYNHSEGSETIDVCFRISPPGFYARDEQIPIYYDLFKDWCFETGNVITAFTAHTNDIIITSYALKSNREIIIEGYLRHLFGIDETESHIKGLVHTPVLGRVEKAGFREDLMRKEILDIYETINDNWPLDWQNDGAYKAVAQYARTTLSGFIERNIPVNKIKAGWKSYLK